MTLLDTFMGSGVRKTLMKRANARLESAIYDGRSRNWTWTKHIDMLRECFSDLEASGERNALSPEQQVEKLVQSYQFQPLIYLVTTIDNDPRYSQDFNAAVSFITTAMANLKNNNGRKGAVANLSRLSTAEDDPMDVDEDIPTATNNSVIAKMKRKVKQLQAKLKKKNDGKQPPHRKNAKSKYNKSDPKAYLDSKAFKALTPEQRKAMIDARKEAGIPTRSRSVRAISSKAKKQPESQAEEELPEASNDPKSLKVVGTVPASLLQAPKRGQGLVTTQRAALYSASTRRVSFSAKTKPAAKDE